MEVVLGIIATLILVVIAGFTFGTLRSKFLATVAFALIWAMTAMLPSPAGPAFRFPCDVTICGWYQANQAELSRSSSR